VKQRIVYAALAALMLAAPASAEPLRLAQAMAPDVLPPHEILTIVRSTGLDPLGQPIRRGPNYVLRAIGSDDHEVRVVINARHGDIVRVVPIMSASRLPPGATMGPYERMDSYEPAPPDGTIAPGPRRYGAAPPAVYEDDEPDGPAPRPPASVPGASRPSVSALPPPVIRATPSGETGLSPPSGSQISRGADLTSPSEPRVSLTSPDYDGLLPPPPERFPQRVPLPAAKSKPVKRAVAAIPKVAPLPKPRPGSSVEASPMPEKKPAIEPIAE
jgi:hypothetical protein